MDYQESVERGRRARRETEDFINSYIHDQRKQWPTVCRSGRVTEEAVQMGLFRACSGIRDNVTLPIISPGSGERLGEGRVAEQIDPKAG